jgi:hypothetical protein
MKVAVLGSGGVGQDLGRGFLGIGTRSRWGAVTPFKSEISEWFAVQEPFFSDGVCDRVKEREG